MREPGAILLVSCYELGHQPLGVAWAAAFLEARGYAPAVMDVSVEPFDPERAARARLVAVSVPMHTALRVGVEVIGRVRAVNPACHVAAYGLYAQLNREYLLAHGVDSVIGGEAEAPLVSAGRGARVADRRPRSRRRDGRPAGGAAPRAPRASRCRAARRCPRSSSTRGSSATAGTSWSGYLEASRGCKHLCRHCPIPPVYGGRFFVVPPDVVLADVRQCVEAGATHLTFGDPDFLNGPRHAVAVARALHAEFPHVSFDFTAKVEHLLRHRALLPELRALGCAFVVSAVESLSDTVLAHLDKGHTRADVVALVRLMREAGIPLRPTWVAFTPWTTLDDYRAMLDFVDAEDLVDAVDPVQYSLRLLVPPGSLLADHPAMRPHLGPLVEGAFSHAWTHPDPRMDALQAEVARARPGGGGGARGRGGRRSTGCAPSPTRAAGRPGRAGRPPAPRPDRARPPRLTEPWFC